MNLSFYSLLVNDIDTRVYKIISLSTELELYIRYCSLTSFFAIPLNAFRPPGLSRFNIIYIVELKRCTNIYVRVDIVRKPLVFFEGSKTLQESSPELRVTPRTLDTRKSPLQPNVATAFSGDTAHEICKYTTSTCTSANIHRLIYRHSPQLYLRINSPVHPHSEAYPTRILAMKMGFGSSKFPDKFFYTFKCSVFF